MTQRERQILQLIERDPMIAQSEIAAQLGITRSSVAVHISNLIKKGYIVGKGYVVRSGSYAVVVGGVNMDIGGRSYASLVDRDSNPGQVRMSLGGVGRNIAHNMALLGVDVKMLTALGDDLYAQKIGASCAELGIDLSHSPVIPGGHTSTYLFINDENGDMALAVSDMDIYEHLTPAFLASRAPLLNNAQVVVMKADIVGDYDYMEALNGLTIAVESGSAGESCANEIADVNVVPLQNQEAALMEVAAGTSDACVIDITMANAMTGEGTSYADLAYEVSLTSEEYGVAFRKESDLTAKFNEFMAKLRKDGTLQALADKYKLVLAEEKK